MSEVAYVYFSNLTSYRTIFNCKDMYFSRTIIIIIHDSCFFYLSYNACSVKRNYFS